MSNRNDEEYTDLKLKRQLTKTLHEYYDSLSEKISKYREPDSVRLFAMMLFSITVASTCPEDEDIRDLANHICECMNKYDRLLDYDEDEVLPLTYNMMQSFMMDLSHQTTTPLTDYSTVN